MRIAIACMLAAVIAIAAASAPVFFDAKLEPPAGRVISGYDDGPMLAAYSKAVAPHAPAMISFDAALDFSTASPFLTKYREFADRYGFFVADVGLSFHGYERDVSIGMRDPDIIVTANGLRAVGRPVLVRIGYDFNAPSALYEPSAYIGAFRHVTDLFHRECPNAATVWNPTAAGFSDSHYLKWYPGDDVVDWWGIHVSESHDLSRDETEAFVEEAERHRKPLVISATTRNLKSEAEALRWYASMFDFVRAHSAVKAVSFGIDSRQHRWPKVASYLKQQLADPRFIDATEAATIFHPQRPEE